MESAPNMKESASNPKESKKRTRSPNYPAVDLAKAIERVEKFFKADGKAGAVADIAAKHLGFTTAHGTAMSVLAALKKFGLVAEVNERIVPTQRAIEIVNLAADDPRRIQAIRDAALSPSIYRELFDAHRTTGLPSNDALERELVTYRQFNPKAVVGFVADFKASLEFAGLSDFSALESPLTESGANELPQITASAAPRTPLPPAIVHLGASATIAPAQQTYRWSLSIPRNITAELKITGADLRRRDIELLEKQLALLKESFDDGDHGA